MRLHSTEHDVLDALAGPVCAVCELTAGSGRAYLRGVLAEGVNDVKLRDDWRRRGGLCPRHWRVWRGLESPALSSTVLLRDLLGQRAAARTHEPVRCPACEVEAKAERRYLGVLGRLPLAALGRALEAGRGFACVRHLAELPEGPRQDLLRGRLAAVIDDLDAFLRLSDHRFAREPKGDTGDAWLRAIRALGGEV